MSKYQSNQNWLQRTSSMMLVLGLLLVTGLFLLTMMISNNSIQESQDLRQQASVKKGQVNINAIYPETIEVGKEAKIELQVTTGGVQVDGIQLAFDIVTDVANSVEIVGNKAVLMPVKTELYQVAHGFSAEMLNLSLNPNKPFSATQPTTVASIYLTPTKSGSIKINFDTERSIAIVHASNPAQDELTHVSPISINVQKAAVGSGEEPVVSDDDQVQQDRRDNLYAITTNLADRFKFYKYDSDQVVAANKLTAGTRYQVVHTVELNNLLRDERSSDPAPVVIQLRAANSGLVPAHLTYSTLLRDKNATNVELETSFVAKEGDNNFVVDIDVNDDIDESDERDNQYTYTIRLADNGDENDGRGGVVSETCNDSCSSNSDCSINERCYQTNSDGKRCRLATNVDSSVCNNPPDNGLNRQCNEYCADTNECGGELTCWYNQCRNPFNVESTSCPQPSSTQLTQIKEGCNKECTANADCANNLTCYNGSCRLATNVSSTSCSATTTKKAAVITTTKTNSNVGIGTAASPKPVSALKNETATTATKAAATPNPTPAPTPIPTRIPVATPEPIANTDESVLDTIMGSVMGVFSSVTESIADLFERDAKPEETADIDGGDPKNNSQVLPQQRLMSYLPLLVIGLGAIIIILVILKILGGLLSKVGGDDDGDGPGESNPTNQDAAPWHPAQKPPTMHGHGMTPPKQATINSQSNLSGGITNPQEIELPEQPLDSTNNNN